VDNTKEEVEQFIKDDLITIRYFYQSNAGKHIALNKGIDNAQGALFVCLDSDDWLYPNAINTIHTKWQDIFQSEKIAGIITLDSFEDGEIVGTKLPEKNRPINWIDLIFNYRITGDKDYYIKTSILKKFKFPSYENNKHMPPSYQYYLISKSYDFLVLN